MSNKTLGFYFADNGVPKTGLTPTINIVEKDGTVHTDGASCSEVSSSKAPGAYYYTADLDESKEYFVYVDAGASLHDWDRYIMELWSDGKIDRTYFCNWNKQELTEDNAAQSTEKVYDDDGNLKGTRVISKTANVETSARYS